MAKKPNRRPQHAEKQQQRDSKLSETKSGHSLKDLLHEDMFSKLKQVEKDMKADIERKEQEEAERLRREQEEREKNKSFGDLLLEYEKKGRGKYGS